MTTINNILGTFAPITLEQMSSVKLMNRTDTKFVTNMAKLRLLLQMAQADYFVQEIDGERNPEYDTTYFDTYNFDMYNQHQWNHTNRQKIRFRTYCVSGLQFMEVKTKNNHGRTKKKRIEVSHMDVTEQQCRLFLGRHLRYDVDVNGRLIGTPVMELVVIDVITMLAITLLERTLKMETSKLVQYDRIELIKPEKRKELIADLELRLGIAVTDVKVGARMIPTATVTSWVWDTRISSKRAGYASHSARPAPLRLHRQTRPSTWLPHQRQPEPAQPT